MDLPHFLSWIYWDPPLYAFTIPFIDLSIAWYGILFVGGFIAGYFLLVPVIQKWLLQKTAASPSEAKRLSFQMADQLTWFILTGTIVGARLGHVLFYDLERYSSHPLEIFMLRKGGLASHGGTIGVLLSLALFLYWNKKRYPALTFITLIDLLTIPTAIVAFFIRLGNFVNQEILGTPSSLPFAIIFGSPAGGLQPVARHPVQLYEAFAYLATFCVLYFLWKTRQLRTGQLSGLFFIFIFGSRFVLEFFKEHQLAIIDQSFLQMGQYLSIPFILLGIWLLFFNTKRVHS